MAQEYASDLLQDEKAVRCAEIAKILRFKPFAIRNMSDEDLVTAMQNEGYGVNPATYEYWELGSDTVDTSPLAPLEEDSEQELKKLVQRNAELEEQVKILSARLKELSETKSPISPGELEIPEFDTNTLMDMFESGALFRSAANHHWSRLAQILMEELDILFGRMSKFGPLERKYIWNLGAALFSALCLEHKSDPWFKNLVSTNVNQTVMVPQLFLHLCGVAGMTDLTFLDEIIQSRESTET